MAETQASRLDRIEVKIDKLSDAMISLARAEEKLIAIEQNNHANFERLNRFSAKLDDIEKKVDDNAHTVQIINRLFWIVAVAIASVVVSQHFPFV
jgi:tetrahydromethanopterin S-methyltransferase subunit G